jgi:hypothetical protein
MARRVRVVVVVVVNACERAMCNKSIINAVR